MASAILTTIPKRRHRIERAIEMLISALDRLDGDADFEPDADCEDDELDDDSDALAG